MAARPGGPRRRHHGGGARGREGHGWERVAHAFDRVTPDHAFDVVRGLFGACATNLSDGNTEVFAEIALAAATFIESFGAQPLNARSARARVLQVTDGVPEFEGVNRLRAGFSLWCDALSESDPKRRSQLVLGGSLDLGAHEQHHLQGAIAGSMDMGMDQSVDFLSQRLAKEGHAGAELDESATDVLPPWRGASEPSGATS